MNWLTKILEALKPDPYFHIAALMDLEGYTDDEIAQEIARMKAAEASKP